VPLVYPNEVRMRAGSAVDLSGLVVTESSWSPAWGLGKAVTPPS